MGLVWICMKDYTLQCCFTFMLEHCHITILNCLHWFLKASLRLRKLWGSCLKVFASRQTLMNSVEYPLDITLKSGVNLKPSADTS